MNNATTKSNEELRKEIKDLIEKIKSDHIKQPANRTDIDYYPTKSVFLKYNLSERSHKRWYDRERHKHMKEALLEFYRNLNPNHEIENVEHIGNQDNRQNTIYPTLTWIDLACYAALIGIEELKTAEQHDQAQNQFKEERIDPGNSNGTELTEVGEEITIEKLAALITEKKAKGTYATHKDTLERLCRERKKELKDKTKQLPTPLYKTGVFMRDIYLKRFDNETGRPLFQRMMGS
jgi:hypothetical protein